MRFLLAPILLLISCSCFSQDPYFVNSNQSLIYLNPSFAGTNGFLRIQTILRVQDRNENISLMTGHGSLDFFMPSINGGMALSSVYDTYAKGKGTMQSFNLTYAQHIWLLDKRLKIIPSLQPSFFIRRLEISQLEFSDPYDPRYNPGQNISTINEAIPTAQKSGFDLNCGMLFQAKNLTGGIAIFHVNQPDQGLLGASKLPLRINLHGSYVFRLTDELNISVYGLILNQSAFNDAYLNCNLSYNQEIFIGGGFRKSNAVTANLGFQFDAVRIGIGYDHGLNTNNTIAYGKDSFEFMLSFNIKNKRTENGPTADWLLW